MASRRSSLQQGRAALAAWLAASGLGPAWAQTAAAELMSLYRKATVCVEVRATKWNGEPDPRLGTGFFLNRAGDLVTANHVIPADGLHRKVEVVGHLREGQPGAYRDREIALQVVYRDAESDLAVLRAAEPNPSPHVVIKMGAQVTEGTDLLVISCPAGYRQTLGSGMVGNVTDDPRGRWVVSNPLDPGSSGAPVFDRAVGKVVGIANGGTRAVRINGVQVPMLGVNLVTPVEALLRGLATAHELSWYDTESASKATFIVFDTPPRTTGSGARTHAVREKVFALPVGQVAERVTLAGLQNAELISVQPDAGGRNLTVRYRSVSQGVAAPLGTAAERATLASHMKRLNADRLSAKTEVTGRNPATGYQPLPFDPVARPIAGVELNVDLRPRIEAGSELERAYELSDVIKDPAAGNTIVRRFDAEPGYRIVVASFRARQNRGFGEAVTEVAPGGEAATVMLRIEHSDVPAWVSGTLVTKQQKR